MIFRILENLNPGIYVNEDGEKGFFLTASSVNILIAGFLVYMDAVRTIFFSNEKDAFCCSFIGVICL